jgi:peptidoglycan/xylan/chitin deacetylase (PgdA/CDA1 family)
VADRRQVDFEHEKRTRGGADGRTGGRAAPTAHHIRIRRRRAVAVLALIALLAVVTVALAHPRHGSARRAQRPHGHTRSAPIKAPPENDKDDAVASVLAYTPFVREGSGRSPEVALTFDDGPGPYTPSVLGVLERYHVHATFFVIGKMLQYFAPSAERELRDGDVLGDHTETHPAMALLSPNDQHEQLFEQIARVELAGGPRPVLFRPPYGSFDATTLRELKRLHLLMVLWSVDTGDFRQPGVAAIVQTALEGAHPGAIILLHDAGGTRTETVEALPLIIKGLRERGLRPVTVPQLLADDPPPEGQPVPTGLSGD